MCDSDDLIEACKGGYYEKVLQLLQRNFSVHIRDSKQATPLYYSCCNGYCQISYALIQYGSDVNARVQWGSTALHAAADRGHIDCVKLLIQSGADLSIQNNRGDTALHLCAYRGYIEIVRLLIQCKSDLFVKNNNEKTPSDEAESNNHLNTAQLLRQNMITIQRKIVNTSNHQIREVPARLASALPPSVNSASSMSLPLTVPQDNFVRYSKDLTRFTRQSLPVTNTESNNSPFLTLNRPKSHPVESESRQEKDSVGIENGIKNLHNGHRNGHENIQNVTWKMLNNNKIPLDVSGREAMENFAETLQIQLVKKIEEAEIKDKTITELKEALKLQNEKSRHLSLICQQLKEENDKLKRPENCDILLTAKSSHRKLNYNAICEHLGILEALKLLQKRSQGWRGDEQSLQTLKEVLKSRFLTQSPATSLDIPNKEWKVGKDFTLLGDKPLNFSTDGDRDGSCSLVFLISHNRKEYVLKMMTNLINLQASQHGDGYSLDQFLIQNFGPEHDIPINLSYHPNIVSVLHYYTGATDRFKKFINLLIPSRIDVPIEMANRTSFLVMQKYPQTLKSFMVQQRSEYPEPDFGLTNSFILHLLYQILSAVYHLQKNGVVHRDIKADNIFLDKCLRPVLTDFGFAKTLRSSDGNPIKITDGRQVYAGNAHAWAPELTRFSRNGIIQDQSDEMTTLEQIYCKADAYAVSRMFYSLLRPVSEGDTFPQSSVNRPHYAESEIPELPRCYSEGLRHILHNLVLDDPIQRITERRALLCCGMLLFYPRHGEIRIESDVITYCQARIFSLLSVDDQTTNAPADRSLTIEESVEIITPVLESDFLLNISPAEFWEIYQYLKLRNLIL